MYQDCVTFVGHRNFWAAATLILIAGEICTDPTLMSLVISHFCQGRRLLIVALMIFYLGVD